MFRLKYGKGFARYNNIIFEPLRIKIFPWSKKQKKSDWVDSKYKPVCRCPYKFRIITWRNGGYGDMRYYMRCPICDKSDFNNDIKIQEQIRQQNINIGLYLRNETTDINIINSLPFDLSKRVIQYI